jgi:hypothetical protein
VDRVGEYQVAQTLAFFYSVMSLDLTETLLDQLVIFQMGATSFQPELQKRVAVTEAIGFFQP